MNVLLVIVAFVVGVILGMGLMAVIVLHTPTSGDVLVASDEDGHYLSLELEHSIEVDVLTKKKVIFNVKPVTK